MNFEAIWEARAGARPAGLDAARAKQYAQVLAQHIETLKRENSSVLNPQHYVGRIKSLAVLLAVFDGRASANHVIDALARPGRWDAHVRITGIRALLLSGVTLSLDSMLSVLLPAIEHMLSQGYHDQNLYVLVDCLELLPFSDDPPRGIARIEEVISHLQYRPYQFRDLVIAMGYTRSDAAVAFLLSLVRGQGGLQNMEDAWIEALGRLNTPAAQNILLSFIDPQVPSNGVNININYHNTQRFAAFVSEWARQSPALKQRLLALAKESLTPTQRHLLLAIYRELADEETMLAGVNLVQDAISSFGNERGFETQFLERRDYGRSGSYVLMPRDAKQARAELFQLVLNDPTRRQAAFSILGQVEVWRIEHGRPAGEPRHPMIGSGVPWPPLTYRINTAT